MIHSHLTARPQTPYCHSERAQRAEESDRWAKAAGEEASWRMPVVLSGALPLTYPAALGLRTSYRPPPFALRRSLRSGRAKAAGEENLCRLFPAAGAAVAAGPASTGSVAHQPHPIRAQEWLFLGTDTAQNAF